VSTFIGKTCLKIFIKNIYIYIYIYIYGEKLCDLHFWTFNGGEDPLPWPRDSPLPTEVVTNITDQRLFLCRYSSIAG
jgi:hypothetical protein